MSVQQPKKKIPLQFKDVSFMCYHCDATFSVQSKLEKHQASAHKKLCPICGLDFSREGKKQHQKRFHPEVMLKCPLCKNSYSGQTLFLDHAKKCQKLSGPGKKPAISIQALSPVSSETKTRVVNSKNQVISEQKTVTAPEGGKAEFCNLSPIPREGKKVLSVDDEEFQKEIRSILKLPVQTSTPKLPNKVIVVDVADLRKKFSNVVQPFSSSQPTAQLGTASSKPDATFQGPLSSKMPDLISTAKPMELVKSSSSKSQAESGKKVLQVEDSEFRSVIKDFLPPATEINPSGPAIRKSARNCIKRKLDNLNSKPSKKLKKVNRKDSVQPPRKSAKKVSFSEVVQVSVVASPVSQSKLSQGSPISIPLAAKNPLAKKVCEIKPAAGTKTMQPIKPEKILQLKEVRVVLPRLPADVVKQCLRDGFYCIKPEQPAQKTICVEVTKQVMQKIKSNLLPKDSMQKVGVNSPIQIVLPPKVVLSLQSKTSAENVKKVQLPATKVQPVLSKESTASKSTRKVEIPPPKVLNNLAPTILQWKIQMGKEYAISTPAPQAVQSNPMKATPLPSVSSTTFKSSVEKQPSNPTVILKSNQKNVQLSSVSPSAFEKGPSKPTVAPQTIKSNQVKGGLFSHDFSSALKSFEKEPTKPAATPQTVKSSQEKVVLLYSDSQSTFEKEPSKLTVPLQKVQSNQKKVVLQSSHSPSTLKSPFENKPSKPTVGFQTVKSSQEKVVLLYSESPSTLKPPFEKDPSKLTDTSQTLTSNQKKMVPLSSDSCSLRKSSEEKGVLQPSKYATTMKPPTTPPLVILLSDDDSVDEVSPPKIKKASAQKSGCSVLNKSLQAVKSQPSNFSKLIQSAVDKEYSLEPSDTPQTAKQNCKKQVPTLSTSVTTESPIVVLLSDTDRPKVSPACKGKTQSKETKRKPDALSPSLFVEPLSKNPKLIILEEKEVILKKMLHKFDEKERLKKEKYIVKKTTKFVEKKLEQLKELQVQLSKTQSPLSANQRRLLRDVSNLLYSFNKQEAAKVFRNFGLEVLLKHIEGKYIQTVFKTSITENKVLNNSYKSYSASVKSPSKVTSSVALPHIKDPLIDLKMTTGEKFLLQCECPCKKPICDHININ